MSMEESKRIRLVFEDDDILSETQKAEGLNKSWLLLLLKADSNTISDVVSHLLHAFQLHRSCPNGLLLSISGFVLPPFESACIFKDNEIVRVRKRRHILSIDENGNTAAADQLGVVELRQQPRNTDDVLRLTNEGRNEIEDLDEEEGEEECQLENSRSKKRKRKAPEKLPASKKKERLAEKSSQGAVLVKEKLPTEKEERTDLDVEVNVKNKEESENEESDASVPGMKRNIEVQGDMKVSGDAQIASEEMKKGPSRSARRKYAKRRLLQEMAKIQKLNGDCDSEGLRNRKKDRAKAERNKVDDQLKGPQNWKKQKADANKVEVDGQPKGLLHWEQSHQNNSLITGKKYEQQKSNVNSREHPSENGHVAELPNQNSDGHKKPNENVDVHEQLNNRNDVHQQPNKINGDVRPNQNGSISEPLNQDGDVEDEFVPIIVRPGHIRFEPLDEEEVVHRSPVPSDTFRWNGITSKKKGQKWGIENTARNDHRNSNKDYSESLSNNKEKEMDGKTDFDKLPPLHSMPKEGDLIAYRVLELSSSWTPELSAYRVGKISLYDAESSQIVLAPVSEYPIISQKTDEDEDVMPDNSLYKEDGTLEIEFSSLADVRVVKSSEPRNGAKGPADKKDAPKMAIPRSNGEKIEVPGQESSGVNLWDQINEALNAKKEQLSKGNSCSKTPNKITVQLSAVDSQEENPKVQPSQENSQDKKSSVDKSWTYKALRGSALGPTMAMLRSKQDI